MLCPLPPRPSPLSALTILPLPPPAAIPHPLWLMISSLLLWSAGFILPTPSLPGSVFQSPLHSQVAQTAASASVAIWPLSMIPPYSQLPPSRYIPGRENCPPRQVCHWLDILDIHP